MTSQKVLIGTYTQPIAHCPQAAGGGIHTVEITASTARLVATTPPSITGANPSYLALKQTPGHLIVYAANETEPTGSITKLHLIPNGTLERVCSVPCGKLPAHVSVISNGVIVACFGDGRLDSFMDDEALRLVHSIRPCEWYDVDVKSCLHMALPFDGNKLFICDPMANFVSIVERDENGTLSVLATMRLEGYPRHAMQHGKGVFHVALAKKREVATVRVVQGDGCSIEMVASAALGDGKGVLGAIRMVEDTVLVSERGADCDRIWRVNGNWVASGGEVPRDFCVTDDLVIAVHQTCGGIGVGLRDGILSKMNGVSSLRRMEIGERTGALVNVLAVDEEKTLNPVN